MVPDLNLTIYPNALPEVAPPARQEGHEIAFSGNLEYQPNISAIRFFRDKIWPALRGRPDLTWKIIGKNPEAVRGIIGGDPRIEVTGFVEDAIRSLASAQVAVVPLLAGSGTRDQDSRGVGSRDSRGLHHNRGSRPRVPRSGASTDGRLTRSVHRRRTRACSIPLRTVCEWEPLDANSTKSGILGPKPGRRWIRLFGNADEIGSLIGGTQMRPLGFINAGTHAGNNRSCKSVVKIPSKDGKPSILEEVMRFSVDAHAVGQHLTGNETYIRNLLNSFAMLDREADFVAYISRDAWTRSRSAFKKSELLESVSTAGFRSAAKASRKTGPTCCTCSTPVRCSARLPWS